MICVACNHICREADFRFHREDRKSIITIVCPKCGTELIYTFRKLIVFKERKQQPVALGRRDA